MCSILGNSRLPDIYFRQDGRIDITTHIIDALGIHDGDVVDIWSEGQEEYLYVMHRREDIQGRHKAVCRSTRKHHRYMRVWSVELCRHILSLTGNLPEAHLYTGSPVVIPGAGLSVPLITRHNLYTTDHD